MLFGLLGLVLIMLVRMVQGLLSLEGFPITLYVGPSCLVLLLASLVSENHVQSFVMTSLVQKLKDQWACLPACQLYTVQV